MDDSRRPDVESVEYRRCADPRKYFADLRAQSSVDTAEGHGGRVQVLTLQEGQRLLRDHETFSSALAGSEPGRPRQIPLQVDPPETARYRRLLDPVFAPRNIAVLESDVAELTNQLIDTFYDKGGCEFSTQLSIPLPAAIFLRIFGLPIEDLDHFLQIKDDLIRASGATPEEREGVRVLRAAEASRVLFRAAIEERTREPRDDLITLLINSEADGEMLNADELSDICNLLLLAGLDTVTISLQCMLYFLATHPEARQMIADGIATVPDVVEELLRWDTPVQGVSRISTRDTEVGGCPFPAGTMFQVMVASINTDNDTAENFEAIDFHRQNNRHFAFGGGVHRCLGSHLARLELRTVLTEWHRRIPEYTVAPDADIVWNGAMLRGIDRLPLVWDVR